MLKQAFEKEMDQRMEDIENSDLTYYRFSKDLNSEKCARHQNVSKIRDSST